MRKIGDFSRIIAGTMTWGSWGKKFSTPQMVELMWHCVEHGLSTFDNADIYGSYTNEAAFGKALAQSGIKRDEIQLISKCGIQLTRGRDNRLNHYQYDSAYITWSVEESLRHLGTDHLDLLLLHRPSPLMEPGEVAAAITPLLESGKIKRFGVSNFSPSQIAMMETVLEVEGNQIEFSLTQHAAMYDGTLDDMVTKERLAMAWGPLGELFHKESPRTKRIRRAMAPLMEKYGANESQLLLAWILRHPAQIHPVIGTTVKKRIEESANAAKITLELQDWFALLVASQGHDVP